MKEPEILLNRYCKWIQLMDWFSYLVLSIKLYINKYFSLFFLDNEEYLILNKNPEQEREEEAQSPCEGNKTRPGMEEMGISPLTLQKEAWWATTWAREKAFIVHFAPPTHVNYCFLYIVLVCLIGLVKPLTPPSPLYPLYIYMKLMI